MAAECLRDRHGFPIAHDCEQLARIYEPLHEKEEEDRAHAWHDFLSCAAAQLGAAPEPSARGGDAALAAAVLPLLMSDAGAPLLPQLSRLVHAGIPCGVRAAIWPLLLRAKRVSPDGHYEALLRVVDADGLALDAQAAVAMASGVSSEQLLLWRQHGRAWLSQIDKDMGRTFPGHARLDDGVKAALRRVLAAFTLHDPALGYCQGMSFVAGALLLELLPDEAAAFGCFAAVVRDVLPGYYAPAMTALQVDQELFRHLVKEHHPRLAGHLEALGVDPAGPLPAWLLSGFVNCLPYEAVLRVWDIAFLERSSAPLMRACLAMVEIYGAALLGSADVLDASQLLHALPSMTFDASRLVAVADRAFADITHDVLLALQHCFRAELQRKREAQQAADARRRAATSAPVPSRASAGGAPAAAAAAEAAPAEAHAAAAEGAAPGGAGAGAAAVDGGAAAPGQLHQVHSEAGPQGPSEHNCSHQLQQQQQQQQQQAADGEESGQEEGAEEEEGEDGEPHVKAQVRVQSQGDLNGCKGCACGEQQQLQRQQQEQDPPGAQAVPAVAANGAARRDACSDGDCAGGGCGARGLANGHGAAGEPPQAAAPQQQQQLQQQQQQQQERADGQDAGGETAGSGSPGWANFQEVAGHFAADAAGPAAAPSAAAAAAARHRAPAAPPAGGQQAADAGGTGGAVMLPSEDPDLYNEASDDFEDSEGTNLLLLDHAPPGDAPRGRPGAGAAAAAGSPGGAAAAGGGGGGGVSAHRYRILDKPTSRRGCLAAAFDIAAAPGLAPDRRRAPDAAAPAAAAPAAAPRPCAAPRAAGNPAKRGTSAGAGGDAASSGSFDGGPPGAWAALGRRSSTMRSGDDEWVDVVPSSSPGGWMAAAVGGVGGGGVGNGGGARHAAVVGRQPGPVLIPTGSGRLGSGGSEAAAAAAAAAAGAAADGGASPGAGGPQASAQREELRQPAPAPPQQQQPQQVAPPRPAPVSLQRAYSPGPRTPGTPLSCMTKAQIAAQITEEFQIAELLESVAAASAAASELLRASAPGAAAGLARAGSGSGSGGLPRAGSGDGGSGGGGSCAGPARPGSGSGGDLARAGSAPADAPPAPSPAAELVARHMALAAEYRSAVDGCTAKMAELMGALADARSEAAALREQLFRTTARLEDSDAEGAAKEAAIAGLQAALHAASPPRPAGRSRAGQAAAAAAAAGGGARGRRQDGGGSPGGEGSGASGEDEGGGFGGWRSRIIKALNLPRDTSPSAASRSAAASPSKAAPGGGCGPPGAGAAGGGLGGGIAPGGGAQADAQLVAGYVALGCDGDLD